MTAMCETRVRFCRKPKTPEHRHSSCPNRDGLIIGLLNPHDPVHVTRFLHHRHCSLVSRLRSLSPSIQSAWFPSCHSFCTLLGTFLDSICISRHSFPSHDFCLVLYLCLCLCLCLWALLCPCPFLRLCSCTFLCGLNRCPPSHHLVL